MAFDQIKYSNAYNKENYDKVQIMVPKGEKESWKALAKEQGISMSEMIRRAVADYFEKV